MILIYTTCRSEHEATRIAHHILERKLAVAVNSWPMHASYMSPSGVQSTSAYALLIQTLENKFQDVEAAITHERPAATPLIGLIDVRRLNHAFKEQMSHMVH